MCENVQNWKNVQNCAKCAQLCRNVQNDEKCGNLVKIVKFGWNCEIRLTPISFVWFGLEGSESNTEYVRTRSYKSSYRATRADKVFLNRPVRKRYWQVLSKKCLQCFDFFSSFLCSRIIRSSCYQSAILLSPNWIDTPHLKLPPTICDHDQYWMSEGMVRRALST